MNTKTWRIGEGQRDLTLVHGSDEDIEVCSLSWKIEFPRTISDATEEH
jgi:hypothetical protein